MEQGRAAVEAAAGQEEGAGTSGAGEGGRCRALALLLGSEHEEAVWSVPRELCGGCEVTPTEVIGAACGRVQWWRGVGG